MKFKDTKINQGGMMRCCTETLMARGLEAECAEGETVQCRYSQNPSHSWILRKGIWAWNR